jgi:hypothetical protein
VLLALVALASSCGGASAPTASPPSRTVLATAKAGPPAAVPLSGTNLLVAGDAGVRIVALDGTTVGDLPGLQPVFSGGPTTYLRAPDGEVVQIQPDGSLVAATPPRQVLRDNGPNLDLPPFPGGPDGHAEGFWVWSSTSPDGRTALAQWSGECESQSAWFVSGGHDPRPVARAADGTWLASFPLGWLADGRAVVVFPDAACGTPIATPGTYTVTPSGSASLLNATVPFGLLIRP